MATGTRNEHIVMIILFMNLVRGIEQPQSVIKETSGSRTSTLESQRSNVFQTNADVLHE